MSYSFSCWSGDHVNMWSEMCSAGLANLHYKLAPPLNVWWTDMCALWAQPCRGVYREAPWPLWQGVTLLTKWSCVALVLNVVCKSATWGSWGFVSQWVSVSEWAQSHGWLMNDFVFLAIPIPQSHHWDIHSPLRRCLKAARAFWVQIRRVRGAPQRWSVSCTQRDVVFSWVKALRPLLCTFGSLKAS